MCKRSWQNPESSEHSILPLSHTPFSSVPLYSTIASMSKTRLDCSLQENRVRIWLFYRHIPTTWHSPWKEVCPIPTRGRTEAVKEQWLTLTTTWGAGRISLCKAGLEGKARLRFLSSSERKDLFKPLALRLVLISSSSLTLVISSLLMCKSKENRITDLDTLCR